MTQATTPMTIDRTTLSREAYRTLRSAILERRLRPGRKLVVRVLAEEMGLSPTPIKAALAALEREGLVVGVPHHGYYVPEPTPTDIEELYALREVVEGLAASLAASRGDAALDAQLDWLLRQQRDCVAVGDVERYGDLDLAFHRALREAARNARLMRVAEAFNGQIRLLISTSARLPGRLSTSVREHEAIVEAVRRRDTASAESAMRQHVRQAGLAVLAHLRAAPPDPTPASHAATGPAPTVV